MTKAHAPGRPVGSMTGINTRVCVYRNEQEKMANLSAVLMGSTSQGQGINTSTSTHTQSTHTRAAKDPGPNLTHSASTPG